MPLENVTWPISQAGEALDGIVAATGWSTTGAPGGPDTDVATPPPEEATLGPWLELASERRGLETQPVETQVPELPATLRALGPALLPLPDRRELVALLGGRGHRLRILTPTGRRRWIRAQDLRDLLCAPLERRNLHRAGQGPSRLSSALLERLLAREPVFCGWIVRPSPGASLGDQLGAAGLGARLTILTATRVLQLFLWIASWWVIGRAALSGRFDPGWLTAWALLLLTLVPLKAWTTETQGRISLSAGAILMRRLLAGALNLGPDTTRDQGIGGLLGRVLESEALSALALAGGFSSFFSILELAAAGWVLWHGASGPSLLLLLSGFIFVSAVQGWILHRERRRWTDRRLALTHDLVEQLLGHQTRLAQAQPGTAHLEEDQGLSRYLSLSRGLDRQALRLALIPRAWLLVGTAGLAPAFVHGTSSQEALAIGLGGILLAHQGFRSLSGGLAQVVAAAIAWDRVSELYRAAGKPRLHVAQAVPEAWSSPGSEKDAVLEVRDLTFRYPHRTHKVLTSLNLAIDPGDRILLEGSSGSGKSTLVSLLNGLRSPSSGLLLLSGLDPATLGSTRWRRRIAAVPQFHENHVFNDSFAFNLLMGRRWPPGREDLREAEKVCHELGLGDLLSRMPGGLGQVVGETGWRLSHGERSRLFIARALLQDADLVIVDESLGALDPETLQQTLRCLEKRAPALLLVAHP